MRTMTPVMSCYLAEWYRPHLTQQVVDGFFAALDAAVRTASGPDRSLRLLVTLAVPTDEVLYGVFTADHADDVLQVCQQAGVPVERLSTDVGARIDREAQNGPPEPTRK